MAAEKLVVKNFGPIRDAELDLRKVTVLIGPQASGKSVLAKLVAICGDMFAPQNLTLISFEDYQIHNFFSENTIFKYDCDKYSVGYKDSKFVKELKMSEASQVILQLELATNKSFELTIRSQSEKDFNQREKIDDEIVYWNGLISEQIEKLGQLFYESCYVPAERISVPVFDSLTIPKTFIQAGNDSYKSFQRFAHKYRGYKKNLKKIVLSPLGMMLESDGSTDLIKQNGTSVRFIDSSSGVQSVAPLIVLVEASLLSGKKNLFIIEEPELNLYPTTQKKLVEYLIAKCTKGENRLIITTHSPYILTALNNCIEANNALKANPEAKAQVDALVPPESQIAFEDVAAYYVADGTARSIMNEEYQMIDANALDDVSDELSNIHSELLDLKYQLQD